MVQTKSKMPLWRIHYTDATDESCPVFTLGLRAYNIEHAEERFFDDDDDGWKIVSIETVLEV